MMKTPARNYLNLETKMIASVLPKAGTKIIANRYSWQMDLLLKSGNTPVHLSTGCIQNLYNCLLIGNFCRDWFSPLVLDKLLHLLPDCQPTRALRESINLFLKMKSILTLLQPTEKEMSFYETTSKQWLEHKNEHLKWVPHTNLIHQLVTVFLYFCFVHDF